MANPKTAGTYQIHQLQRQLAQAQQKLKVKAREESVDFAAKLREADHDPSKCQIVGCACQTVLTFDQGSLLPTANKSISAANAYPPPPFPATPIEISPLQAFLMANGFYMGITRAPRGPAEPTPEQIMASKIAALKNVAPGMAARRAPDYMQTIVAYRGWAIEGDRLASIGKESVWEPKKFPASTCSPDFPYYRTRQHKAPSRDCECGYWSFKTMDLLLSAINSYADEVRVVGSIEIWGKVIECENGWRSEFAYPKELWLLDSELEHLSWEYGVPIRTLGEGKI